MFGSLTAAQAYSDLALIQDVADDSAPFGFTTPVASALGETLAAFIPPTPEVYCPTSSCKIPDFTSLATCYECQTKEFEDVQLLKCSYTLEVEKHRTETEFTSYAYFCSSHKGLMYGLESFSNKIVTMYSDCNLYTNDTLTRYLSHLL